MAMKKKNTVEVDVDATKVDVTPTPTEELGKVDIDTSAAKVEDTQKSDAKLVRVRMRSDHRCTVAGTRYVLKAGETYTVPQNVKFIPNRAGVLAPLN
jgi:hypothetical protein